MYRRRSRARKNRFLLFTVIVVLLGSIWMFSRTRGPYHGYELDVMIPDITALSTTLDTDNLHVGVAKRDITPRLRINGEILPAPADSLSTDPPDDAEIFDRIWLAGFSNNRSATGVNDPLWVRAIALRNNGVTLVLVTIDSVGIYHNDFIYVRKGVNPDLGIDHIAFSTTHTHSAPDTMKLWSGRVPFFGFDSRYLEWVRTSTIEAVEEAVLALEPAEMYYTQVRIEPEGFVRDSRNPVVMDDHMYLMHFVRPGTEGGEDIETIPNLQKETIATFVNWGNHPEVLDGKNQHITSDFSHWLRKGLEEGVPAPYGISGFGGMCLYFQGQLGGLMTPLGMEVPHRDGERMFKDATFEKAESLGYNLAIVANSALRSADVRKNENPLIAVAARTIRAPLQGYFRWAIKFGLIHEGYYFGGKAKTEINVIRIGDVLMLTIPGEIYPEIVEGGIVALEGRDFPIDPVEVPPLRTYMNAEASMAMVLGLANDEIGYIIPKSQWDTKKPWVYEKKQYGEINSGGPDVAPVIYNESRDLLEDMNEAWRNNFRSMQ